MFKLMLNRFRRTSRQVPRVRCGNQSFEAAVLVALAALGAACSSTTNSADGGANAPKPEPREVTCPSIHIKPHATLTFERPLSVAGSYGIELEVDGVKEACTLTLANIGPAVDRGAVTQGPSTKTAMSCKAVRVSGITNSGHIAGLKTSGTPAKVKLAMSHGDTRLLDVNLSLDYVPSELHGRGCQKTQHAAVMLKLGPPKP